MIDVYVINLNRRTDRWTKIQQDMDSSVFNLIRVEAVEHENGAIGCFMSHKKCLEIAKEKKLKNIVVMEDDCIPIRNNDCYERFKTIKDTFLDKRDDWDIFLGGAIKTHPRHVAIIDSYKEDDLYKIYKSHSAYMIVYNHTSYNFFINSDVTIPVDYVWHRRMHGIIPLPFLFTVSNGMSDICKKYYSGNKRILENEAKLIKATNHKTKTTIP